MCFPRPENRPRHAQLEETTPCDPTVLPPNLRRRHGRVRRRLGPCRHRDPVLALDGRRAGRPRQRAGRRVQQEEPRIPGQGSLQGQLRRVDECGHRRVPRRQRARHPPGLRSRHRHHDVRQGRHLPVQQMSEEAGNPIDPKEFIGAVAGYYSSADGKLVSMPFNSSTVVFYYNKDAFKKAGLTPTSRPRPGKSWPPPARSSRPPARNAATPPRGRPGSSWKRSRPGTTCPTPPGQRLRRPGRPRCREHPLHVRHLENPACWARKASSCTAVAATSRTRCSSAASAP